MITREAGYWRVRCCFALALLLPLTGFAAVVPAGKEISIGTIASSTAPDQVVWTGTRFAIVYVEGAQEPPAPVHLRYVSPFSDVPTEPIVLAQSGARPVVAAFPDGSLVVAWTDYHGWFVRFVDPFGTPVGEAASVGFSNAWAASLAAGSQDEWVLVLYRYVEETGSSEIAGMRYHGTIPEFDEPFVIEATTYRPATRMLADNRFLVAWNETIWDEGCDDCGFMCCYDWHRTFVLGRTFDSNGEPLDNDHFLGTFHNDEAGLNGYAIARAGSFAFAAAWIDTEMRDVDAAPAYIVLQMLDGDGSRSADSRVLASTSSDPEGISVAMAQTLAVVAVVQPYYDEEWKREVAIELYSTETMEESVEKFRLLHADGLYVWMPLLAGNDSGAVLLTWHTSEDPGPVADLVARPFFAASRILCGDANYDRTLGATDSLATLRSAVGVRFCALPVCDATGDGAISASDANVVLKAAVGIEVVSSCPPTGVPVPPSFDP